MIVTDLNTTVAKLKEEITIENPVTVTWREPFLFLKR
jgi:hypothetical protein